MIHYRPANRVQVLRFMIGLWQGSSPGHAQQLRYWAELLDLLIPS